MAGQSDFLGKGWTFPVSFDPANRRTVTVGGDDSILTSLRILMGTAYGERLMQPRFGTDFQPYLFRKADKSIATKIRAKIKNAIVEFEPRITLNNVTVDVDRIQEGIMVVTLDYTVRRTNTRNNIVFPFYVQEGNLVPERLT